MKYILYGYENGQIPWSQDAEENTIPKVGMLAEFRNAEQAAAFKSALHETTWAANAPLPATFGGTINRTALLIFNTPPPEASV